MRIRTSIVFLIASFCFAGNSSRAETQKPAASALQMPSSVLVFDRELAEKTSILSQDARRDINKVLIARTVFKNETTEVLKMHAQTFFKDAKGQTVEASPKKEIVLGPLAEQTYIAASVKQKMNRFVVYLRMKTENPDQLTHQTPLVLEMPKKRR